MLHTKSRNTRLFIDKTKIYLGWVAYNNRNELLTNQREGESNDKQLHCSHKSEQKVIL